MCVHPIQISVRNLFETANSEEVLSDENKNNPHQPSKLSLLAIMSEEESDATTAYPDISNFENNEAKDNRNNYDIQITTQPG